MDEAVERYLARVERELRKVSGIHVESAVANVRELLEEGLEEMQSEDLDNYDALVARFGRPEEIASAHAEHEDSSHKGPLGHAPGWRLVCSSCGRSTPAANGGLVRVGALSWGKILLGFCRPCRRLRVMRLVKDC